MIITIVSLIALCSRLPYFEEKRVDSGDAKLFCRVAGKEEGTPLVVLHGGPGLSQEYLLPQLGSLAKNQRVIFYDQRGSGESVGGNEEEKLTLEVFMEDLERIRESLGSERMSLLGHSWGGLLAMHYALAHPERIDKLVLMNPAPASSQGNEEFLQAYLHLTAPFQNELQKIEHSEEFAVGDPETLNNYLKMIFAVYCADPKQVEKINLRASSHANVQGMKTLHRMDQEINQPYDLHAGLRYLECPTLIIHGDKDPIPVPAVERIHAALPHSELVVFEECGHFPYIEKPKECFALLNSFLHDER
jgi:proline iminopeptidase